MVSRPNKTGIPITPITVINSCSVGIARVLNTELADAAKYFTYSPPHIAKFKGVNIGAAIVVIVTSAYNNYRVICSAMIGCLRKIEAEEANFSTDSVVRNLIVPP